eukprot:scaffold58900_cov66-Phaeocystis_antarctica.AAC.2
MAPQLRSESSSTQSYERMDATRQPRREVSQGQPSMGEAGLDGERLQPARRAIVVAPCGYPPFA